MQMPVSVDKAENTALAPKDDLIFWRTDSPPLAFCSAIFRIETILLQPQAYQRSFRQSS